MARNKLRKEIEKLLSDPEANTIVCIAKDEKELRKCLY